jgi:hypothetical protein
MYREMKGLPPAMISSTRNFAERHSHTFGRATNTFFRRAQKLPEIQRSDEMFFYETTVQASQCGKTRLPISKLGINPPCSHLSSMGATWRPLPGNIALGLEECMETFGQYNLRFAGDEGLKDDESDIECFKSLAVRAVKQPGHHKKTSMISDCLWRKFSL